MPRQNKDNHSTSPILAAIERLSQKIEEQRCNHHDHSDRLARIEFEVFEMKTMLEEVNEKLNSVIGAPAVQPEVNEQEVTRPVERDIKRPVAWANGKAYLPDITKSISWTLFFERIHKAT